MALSDIVQESVEPREMITAKRRFPLKSILLHGWWPSFLKCFYYRLRGYRVGRRVKIGFGSVLCLVSAEIGDDVSIGFFSFFRGRELRLGNRVQIGSMCFFDTPYVEIGDDSKFNEQIFVGGLQFPDSRLTVGKNCQVMQMTFINPTRHINIGDDTGIGGDSLLFGHASWLSRFEGYPVDFRPIEIGKSVSIAWRVFVGAGAEIGDGAVIGANSFVNHVIPERCLAAGSPARVIGRARAPYFPRHISDDEKVSMLHGVLAEMEEFLRGHGVECRRVGSDIEISWKQKGWFGTKMKEERIRFETAIMEGAKSPELTDGTTVFLSLRRLPSSLRREMDEKKVLWFDMESKERSNHSTTAGEELAQYLRRHGVRFNRENGTAS